MAAGNIVVYMDALERTFKQSYNWASNTFVANLVSHGYTPDYSSDSDFATDVTQVLTTSGYAAKKFQASSMAPSSASHLRFDAADITLSASATMTAKYLVISHDTSGKVVAYADLETGTTSGIDATQIVIQFNASGLFEVNHSGT